MGWHDERFIEVDSKIKKECIFCKRNFSKSGLARGIDMKPHITVYDSLTGSRVWQCKLRGTTTMYSKIPSEAYRIWDIYQKHQSSQWEEFSNEHHSGNDQELE